jgi:hypothetical protein
MKRILFAAVLTLVAGCATKPPTATDLLLGKWSCESSGQAKINADIVYLAGGTGTFHLAMSGGQGGLTIEAAGDGEATWKLLEGDTKLEDTITSLKITSAKMNGQVIDPGMAQGMIEGSIKGQSTTSTIQITKTTLVRTATDGTVTNCTR